MNSMIENLVIDMRALGIRSLALELSDDPSPLSPSRTDEREREALAPGDFSSPEAQLEVEPEFRGDPNQCAVEGCGEPNGGVLGGKQRALCRKHAFAKLGIK